MIFFKKKKCMSKGETFEQWFHYHVDKEMEVCIWIKSMGAYRLAYSHDRMTNVPLMLFNQNKKRIVDAAFLMKDDEHYYHVYLSDEEGE